MMTEYKYQIGDRVRVLTNPYAVILGPIGTITRKFWMNRNGTECYGVVMDDDPKKTAWALRIGILDRDGLPDGDEIELLVADVTEDELEEVMHSLANVSSPPTDNASSPPIDWRKMFKEYAHAVGEYEGVDFLNKIEVTWTETEWEAVNDLWIN